MLNQDLITEIRNKTDIVDIIGERIPLTAKGKNFFGVCPFHEDTNPSMSVSREKQIFRCFSCGASGNVFSFLMDYEHKSFKEVLKELGDRVGVNTSSIKTVNISTKYDNLYEAYNVSLKYYQNNLNSKEGRDARSYLLSRKLDEEVIKEFGIGLSLDKKDELVKLLQNKKYDLAVLNNIGLAIDNHDTFMNRIMFPLYDPYGKIVGFSGRMYKTEDKSLGGKYINTKETIIFKKGSCLYHYHIAKDICRTTKNVIVMEGFMDVIRASTIGIRNTVALMGTALTDEQIRLIKRLSNNVILCLDGDDPGRNAALKNGKLLMDEGFDVKVVILPNLDDPDTYILNNGKDKFISMIDSAINYSDFKIEKLKENINFNSEEDLSKYINSVLEETVKINDEIRVEIILKKLAKDYNIGYNTLEKRFNSLKENKTVKEIPKIEKKKKQSVRKDKYIQAMEQIIYFMINDSWVIEQVENENIIYPTNNERLLTTEIIYYYKKNREFSLADFYTYLQDKQELLSFLNEIISSNYIEKVDKKDLFAYFKVLKDYSKSKQIERLEEKMKLEVNPDIQAELAEEIRKLKLGE